LQQELQFLLNQSQSSDIFTYDTKQRCISVAMQILCR
jgi:hypothetical protein